MDPQQKRDEAQFREIEKALLYAEDASAKIGKIAKQLRKEGTDTDLVTALEAGSEAIRAEHRQMMKWVYFRAPGSETNDYR